MTLVVIAGLDPAIYLPQHCLYFFPLPQGHGSLRPTFGIVRRTVAFALCVRVCIAPLAACLRAASPLNAD